MATGWMVIIVNGVWSILSSVEDVTEYNRRAAAAPDGAALDVRPVFRVLPGGGGPLTPSISRAGLEVVRPRF